MNGIRVASVVQHAMKNQIKTILLLGVLSAILIGFGAMLGRQWVVGFTLLALMLNLGAYFFSHKIVLPMPERVRRLRGMQFVRYAA